MDSREMSFWEGSYELLNRRIQSCRTHSSSAFRPCGALLFPLRVGPLQQILGAGTAQMRAAVLHYHLAVDVTGGIGNQETRQVGQLAVFTDAAERIFRCPALVAALGPQLPRGARGRKRAGRDRHRADALRS